MYQEGKAIPGSISFIKYLEKINFPYVFLTNTTTKPRKLIAKNLESYGLKVNHTKIITPLVVTNNYLEKNKISKAAFIFNKSCLSDFPNVQDDKNTPEAIILGDIYKKFSWKSLNEIFHLALKSKKLIAFHKNRVGTRNGEVGLDLGPFVKCVEFALNKNFKLVGKPNSSFFKTAINFLKVNPKNALMVGDDINVDVYGAKRSNIPTCLVKTGKFSFQKNLFNIQPDLIVNNLASLKKFLF